MTSRNNYKPLSRDDRENYHDDDNDDDNDLVPNMDEEDGVMHELVLQEEDSLPPHVAMEPIEISSGLVVVEQPVLFTWSDPWLPATAVTLLLATPVLIGNCLLFYHLLGEKLWTTTPFILHLLVSLLVARVSVVPTEEPVRTRRVIVATSAGCVLDIAMFAVVYPLVWTFMMGSFFTDFDGTDVVEWSLVKREMSLYKTVGYGIGVLRFTLGCTALLARHGDRCMGILHNNISLVGPFLWFRRRILLPWRDKDEYRCSASDPSYWRLTVSRLLLAAIAVAGLVCFGCIVSVARHWLPWSAPRQRHADCDPLDETECIFPFPSYNHMKRDNTTATGWRVHLPGHVLPPLKGRNHVNPHVLNQMDGFSTMAPLSFYIEGLKEAHDAGIDQLVGLSRMAHSITLQSVTLLLEVEARRLVAHSAELDLVDPKFPSVLVFPARPLKHNTHYALAVLNSKGAHGQLLPPTKGMQRLMADSSSPRRKRYLETLIPALESAAHWFSYSTNSDSLQLLFDFSTASEESQLGTIRAVRDQTIAQLNHGSWSWKAHARTIRIDDHDCSGPEAWDARTVHAELDVPWFLSDYGPGKRAALLSHDRTPRRLGTAKFVAYIPCSVRAAALQRPRGKPVRAVVEFGHGLLASRMDTVGNTFLHKMAHEEGYIIVAMDWRGMSIYDLFTFAKAILAKPGTFEAVRDNLIQGYANKYALQDFVRDGMLSRDWFVFKEKGRRPGKVPTLNGKAPSQVFYGISQGGILGAGYATLSGSTGLIDRTILGCPGTPLSLILTRTIYYVVVKAIALLNMYNSRHVRIFMSLMQMGYDSVEGSGVLAAPIREPYPRTLLHAGLGDVMVPAIGAEALARAFNASVLPNSPRSVYGVPTAEAASNVSDGPYVTLTELLYETDYASIPAEGTALEMNGVHFCLREDAAIIRQTTEFINSGRVVNPCSTQKSCHRSGEVQCSQWPK